ncbi:hypothetical protein HMPREF0297_0697 [Corynebacterium jeikeium ATCC 43734]|nr:hypothetical protein HMPREF0297_0697 [Corynebacterium jeikeium ATCC 43734]
MEEGLFLVLPAPAGISLRECYLDAISTDHQHSPLLKGGTTSKMKKAFYSMLNSKEIQ